MKVSIDVLSMGNANPVALAINAASTALMCSNIPWGGPVGAVHLAHTGGNILVTPSTKDGAKAEMSLLIATTQDEVVMAEFQVSICLPVVKWSSQSSMLSSFKMRFTNCAYG